MVVKYTKDFIKDSGKLKTGQQEKLKVRLHLFGQDQFNPVLNNHALKGKYLGYRSINVTGDLRVIFWKNNDEVIFAAIDSHSNLYS
ncbi:type II toxin-antitoxin system mRNA interferase toxin, RelE/StbE family [Candidatus Daviesbacteria bacterium]|nr:type II toxin-antitoxin system mRNA interferase toxin, RelE/StbE family [Candidatus Daviesbacteria bacterium]